MSDTPGEGHNSESYRVIAKDLRAFVERYEAVEAERKELNEQIADVKRDAKARGYDVKALVEIVKRRKRDREAVKELDAIVARYEESLEIFG